MAGLDDYENVKSRKLRFYAEHKDGRIIVELINSDLEEKAVFKASIYLNADEQAKGLARAVGYALEMRDKTKPLNKYGKEYESVNYTSWTENCEESAVGRALDNAGFMSQPKCSKEEMEKAGRQAANFNNSEHTIGQVTTVTKPQAAPARPAAPAGHVPECCGVPMKVSQYNQNQLYCPKCKSKQNIAA
jgi:hypothetical protein